MFSEGWERQCEVPTYITIHTHNSTFFGWPWHDSSGKLLPFSQVDFGEIWQLSDYKQGAVHGHLTLSGKDFSTLVLNSALHVQSTSISPKQPGLPLGNFFN